MAAALLLPELLNATCPGNTFFWKSAGASTWNTAANWSNTSGGAACTNVPFSSATVVFDGNGVGSCNINIAITVSSFTMSAGYTGTIATQNNNVTISSNFVQNAGTFNAGSSSMTVKGSWLEASNFISGTSSVTFNGVVSGLGITNNGKPFSQAIFNGVGGTWVLQDSMTVTSTMTLTNGTLDTNASGNFPVAVGGPWLNQTAGRFAANHSTVTFTATTGQQITSRGSPFDTIKFNGTGGAWTLIDSLTVTTDLLLAAGTLTSKPIGTSQAILLGGDWDNSGGAFTAAGSTVTMSAISTAQQITSRGSPFNRLTILGTAGYWTMVDSMTVSTITVNAGNTLETAGQSVSVSSISIMGTLVMHGTETIAKPPTLVAGSTVTYNATSGAPVVMSTWTYRNLVINGSGSTFNIIGGSLTVVESLNLSGGALDTTAANNYAIIVSSSWINGAGRFTARSSTVTFAGTTAGLRIATGGDPFYNLYFNGTGGTWIMQDSMTVISTITLAAGTLNSNAASSLGIVVGGDWVNTAGVFITNASTVTFSGTTIGQKIKSRGNPFAHIAMSGSGGYWTMQDSMTLSSDLTIAAGALDSNAASNFPILAGGSWFNTGGNFIPNASTVTFTATTTGNIIQSGGDNFSYVQFNGSGGYWTLQDSITVVSTITLTVGTLDSSANNVALSISGGWFNTGGTYIGDGSTVTFRAIQGQKIATHGSPFDNLVFNGTGGNWVMQDSMTVTSSLVLTAGTLNTSAASSFAILLGGDFNNSGAATFTANGSTLTLRGTGKQTVTDPGQFGVLVDSNTSSGGVVFASSFTVTVLTINSAALGSAMTAYFNPTSTYTITTLNLLGASGQTITISPTTAGTWELNNTVDNVITFADVQGSDARLGIQIVPTSSIDSGGNRNWNFGGAGQLRTWVGISNTNWSKGTNWDTGIPAPEDSALIVPGTPFMPTLSAAVTISSLTITSGSSVTLAGFNLTLSSFSNAGAFSFKGSETVTAGPDSLDGSTVTYVGTSGTLPLLSTWTYSSLWINGLGGTFLLTGPVTVQENLTLQAGTLDASLINNYGITVSSNWTNTAGAFNARASSVTFAGTGPGLRITSHGSPFASVAINAAGGYYTMQDSMTLISTMTLIAGTLDCKSGSNLTIIVGGDWNNQNGDFVANAGTVTFDATALGHSITNNGDPFNAVQFNGAGGYWTLQDSMTVSTMTLTAGTLDSNAAGPYDLIVSRDWLNTGGNFIPNQNTVNFTATTTNNKIKSGTRNFNNVVFNGSGGTWVMQDSMTVLSDLSLAAGLLNTNAASSFALSVGGNWNNTAGFFTVNTSTVNFIGSSTGLDITSRGSPFANVVINGSGGYWTLQDSMTVSTITITAGALDVGPGPNAGMAVSREWLNNGGNFIAQASTVTFSAATTNNRIKSGGDNFDNVYFNGAAGGWVLQDSMTVVSTVTLAAGTLSVPANTHGMVVGGSWVNNGGFATITSTVTFNALSPGMTIRSRGSPFLPVFIGSNTTGGYYTLIDSITVSTMTINVGNTLELAGQQFQLNNFSNYGTFTLKGNEKITAVVIGQSGSTVNLNSAAASIVPSTWTYHNLTISGAGTFNATGALSVNEDLTLSAGTLDMTAGNFGITLAGDWVNTAGNFTARSSTVTFNSGSPQSITSGGDPFANVVFNNASGYWTMQDSMTVSTITITAGTLDTKAAGNFPVAVNREWLNTGGNFMPNISTVTFNATTTNNRIKSGGDDFGNVLFNGAAATWVLQDSMTVTTDLTFQAGTLNTNAVSNQPILIGGDWVTTGGAFTINLSTVTFIGTGSQHINNAGQSFWVLIDSNSSASGVTFESSFTATSLTLNANGLGNDMAAFFNAGSTFTITGLRLLGSSGNQITLRPNPANQTWLLKTTTNTVSFTDVAYSSASAGAVIIGGANSTDSGNNTNWTFKILSVTLSPATYDFTSVNLGGTTQSVSAIAVTNLGNITETYSLSVTTAGATVWAVGIATPTSLNTFVLEGQFNTTQPTKVTFTNVDVITSTPTASSAGIYSGTQTGVSAAIGAVKNLWLSLFMPSSSTTTSQQSMNLSVSASSP